jgi:hypothetical protein
VNGFLLELQDNEKIIILEQFSRAAGEKSRRCRGLFPGAGMKDERYIPSYPSLSFFAAVSYTEGNYSQQRVEHQARGLSIMRFFLTSLLFAFLMGANVSAQESAISPPRVLSTAQE